MQELDDLLNIEDPVKKRAYFVALLSEEIVKKGGRPPIIVGGEALEIYTQGAYTTGDIDLKTPFKLTEEILEEWDFFKGGRTWVNEKLDIYVDLLGEALEEGPEAEKRVEQIEIAQSKIIRVLSIEDLVIDRLNSSKWWGDKDSRMWVKIMFEICRKIGKDIDMDYLKKRASSEDVEDILNEALQELNSDKV